MINEVRSGHLQRILRYLRDQMQEAMEDTLLPYSSGLNDLEYHFS